MKIRLFFKKYYIVLLIIILVGLLAASSVKYLRKDLDISYKGSNDYSKIETIFGDVTNFLGCKNEDISFPYGLLINTFDRDIVNLSGSFGFNGIRYNISISYENHQTRMVINSQKSDKHYPGGELKVNDVIKIMNNFVVKDEFEVYQINLTGNIVENIIYSSLTTKYILNDELQLVSSSLNGLFVMAEVKSNPNGNAGYLISTFYYIPRSIYNLSQGRET